MCINGLYEVLVVESKSNNNILLSGSCALLYSYHSGRKPKTGKNFKQNVSKVPVKCNCTTGIHTFMDCEAKTSSICHCTTLHKGLAIYKLVEFNHRVGVKPSLIFRSSNPLIRLITGDLGWLLYNFANRVTVHVNWVFLQNVATQLTKCHFFDRFCIDSRRIGRGGRVASAWGWRPTGKRFETRSCQSQHTYFRHCMYIVLQDLSSYKALKSITWMRHSNKT